MRYKIYETVDGFRVARLEDYGCGWAYNPLPKKFETKDEAEEFIRKEGEANAEKSDR